MDGGTCQGTTRDGRPCQAKALPDDHFCPWHSPHWADRRRQWSSEGGRQKSNVNRAKKQLPYEPMSAEEVHSYLGAAFKAVLCGKLEPGIGTAAANIARSMVTVKEAGEIEERLSALEASAGIGGRRA